MMNRKGIRILITLVLAAAFCSALGSEAHAAAWGTRNLANHLTFGSKAPRRTQGPYSGEPEAGGTLVPTPPRTGASPTAVQPSDWAARVQWMIRTVLEIVPKRFP
jgi:hypothetical protein